MSNNAYLPAEYTACNGEEFLYIRDVIEVNRKLANENNTLKESCQNFVDVEGNLIKKVMKLQEANTELLYALDSLVDEFQNLKSKELIKGYKGYLRALKTLDKYSGEVKKYA